MKQQKKEPYEVRIQSIISLSLRKLNPSPSHTPFLMWSKNKLPLHTVFPKGLILPVPPRATAALCNVKKLQNCTRTVPSTRCRPWQRVRPLLGVPTPAPQGCRCLAQSALFFIPGPAGILSGSLILSGMRCEAEIRGFLQTFFPVKAVS